LAIQPQRKLGYDDYVHFPDDGRRWELIDGEAFMVPSPTTGHQDVILQLAILVKNHLDEHGGGRVFVAPLDVLLSDSDVVQPDVMYVSDADAHVITEKNIRGAPTWVIEVVSDPVRDRKVKRDLYMRYGVSEYWAVEAELRRIEVHRPGVSPRIAEPPENLSPQALPELSVNLERVFGP
jgi:Uma2 family endonuclease